MSIQLEATNARVPITVTATLGKEVKFSLRTRDPAIAKLRTAASIAHLEKMYAAVRTGPRPVPHKQRVALAGDLYNLIEGAFFDDPVDAAWWSIVEEVTGAALSGKLTDLGIRATTGRDGALGFSLSPALV